VSFATPLVMLILLPSWACVGQGENPQDPSKNAPTEVSKRSLLTAAFTALARVVQRAASASRPPRNCAIVAA